MILCNFITSSLVYNNFSARQRSWTSGVILVSDYCGLESYSSFFPLIQRYTAEMLKMVILSAKRTDHFFSLNSANLPSRPRPVRTLHQLLRGYPVFVRDTGAGSPVGLLSRCIYTVRVHWMVQIWNRAVSKMGLENYFKKSTTFTTMIHSTP